MNETIHFGLLQITGTQAKKFLQGQLTCNLDEPLSLGAHCNPQGRIISLFHISGKDEDYYLKMPRDLLPVAMQALQKYAVFFKVKLIDSSEQLVEAATAKLPFIQQGIPHIYARTSEKFLPHDLNLPALNAVSFNKGCYTGQEIIARMQYRGKLKNHLYHARTRTTLAPQPGDSIYSAGKHAGNIVDCCQIDYNNHELLIVAADTDVQTGTLSLDAENQFLLEIF